MHLCGEDTGFSILLSAIPSYDLEALITTLQASVSLTNKEVWSTTLLRRLRELGGTAEKTHAGYFITSFFPPLFHLRVSEREGQPTARGKRVRIYSGGAGCAEG